MLNLQRQKYLQLMREIEALEDEIDVYENREGIDPEIEDDDALEQDLQILRQKLSEKKNELKRISDGCGTYHSH